MHDTSAKPATSLAENFRPELIGYFQRRVTDRAEAEDLAQEVFLRVLRRGDAAAAISDLRAYLFEIALNVLIDRSRRAKSHRKTAHQPFDAHDHGAEEFPIDRVLLGKEALNRATAALLDLPERTRTIFVLRRLEGMKHLEIARRLGISVSAVAASSLPGRSPLSKPGSRQHRNTGMPMTGFATPGRFLTPPRRTPNSKRCAPPRSRPRLSGQNGLCSPQASRWPYYCRGSRSC